MKSMTQQVIVKVVIIVSERILNLFMRR